MPNLKGGKNFKKAGKRKSKNPNEEVPTDTGLDFHAVVNSKLGGIQFEVTLIIPQQIVHAIIPGKFRRKVWINKGDYVHVKKFGDVYEIYQKLERENEKDIARQLHYKFGKNDDIFSKNEDNIQISNNTLEDEDEVKVKVESELGSESESGSESGSGSGSGPGSGSGSESGTELSEDNHVSTKNLPKSVKFDDSKLRKKTISGDKLRQKMKNKESDISRRTDVGFIEKPASIIEKKDHISSKEFDTEVNIDDM